MISRFKTSFESLFKDNGGRPISVTAALTCFFCYFYLAIYGHGGPDSVAEGVHFYRNADWATECARWMIRYLDIFFGKNVIIPFIVVTVYCAMIAVSCVLLVDMLKLKSTVYRVLLSAVFISFPVITDQFAYLYMALSYSFSFLIVVLGIWLIRDLKPLKIAFSVPCFLLMLGSYQAYIAEIAALGLIMFIMDVIKEDGLKKAWLRLGAAAGSALAACLINFPVTSFMIDHYHVSASDRVNGFSLGSIIENLGFTLKYSYIWFFTPFMEQVRLFKNKLYVLVFVVLAAAMIAGILICIKKKKILHAVMAAAAFLLLPLAMNVCVVLFPSNGINNVMRHQYVLIFALAFALIELMSEGWIRKITAAALSAAVFVLVCTYVLSANCTWMLNKMIYDHCIDQAVLMVGQAYELDDFHYGETPIVLGGPIDYSDLRGIYAQIFEYSRIGAGPILWEDCYGMTQGRYHFFREYMGIEACWIDVESYLNIVNSDEFAAMPVWPDKGSVAMINGCAVIKNSETPPQ